MLQLFYLSVAKLNLDVGVEEAQALVVQLLQLPLQKFWVLMTNLKRHGNYRICHKIKGMTKKHRYEGRHKKTVAKCTL
jgi:hypothetical protein